MSQMSAGGERHAHDRVARLQQREQHRLIGLGAGIWLHIDEFAIEQLFRAVDRELLGDVDEFAAAIIAAPGIALSIFVGEHRALRLKHRARNDVLRRDQLDLAALAAEFLIDRRGELGIDIGERGGEEAVGVGKRGCGRSHRRRYLYEIRATRRA